MITAQTTDRRHEDPMNRWIREWAEYGQVELDAYRAPYDRFFAWLRQNGREAS